MTLKFKQKKQFSIKKEYSKFPEIQMQWKMIAIMNIT